MTDRTPTGDLPPSGCRYCGHPERGHAQRWHESVHWHIWFPPLDRQIKERMMQRRADRIADDPNSDLRERLTEALYRHTIATGLPTPFPPDLPEDPWLERARQADVARADAVLPIVEAETDTLTYLLRKTEDELHEQRKRAEKAERQRDEAKADADRFDELLIAERAITRQPQLRGDHAEAAIRRACSCDADPIECTHEAARGHAEATVERVREAISGLAWEHAVIPVRLIRAALDQPEDEPSLDGPGCHVIEVDGEPVRVQGDPDMPAEAREALADLVRAVQARLAGADQPEGDRHA